MTTINHDLATKVKYILTKWFATKDNDMLLVAQFWALESKFNEKNQAYEVFDAMSKGTLTSYESITRARRKLQEMHPELRGLSWEKRHKRQSKVIEDVRSIR